MSVQVIWKEARKSRWRSTENRVFRRKKRQEDSPSRTTAGRSPMSGRSTTKSQEIRSSAKRSPVVRPKQAGRPPNSRNKGRKAGRSLVVRPERAGLLLDWKVAWGAIEAVVRPIPKNDRRISIKPSYYLGRSFAQIRRTTTQIAASKTLSFFRQFHSALALKIRSNHWGP